MGLCSWWRSLKLKHQLRHVLDAIGVGVTHKTLMLILAAMAMRRGSTAGRPDPLMTGYDPTGHADFKRADYIAVPSDGKLSAPIVAGKAADAAGYRLARKARNVRVRPAICRQ